jgi:hypothetical protein
LSESNGLVRDLWIKARLGAPPFVQRTIIPGLHKAKEIVRLLANPYLSVYQLQGQAQGGLLTVTYIGLEFAKPFLKRLLFLEDPVEQQVGQIPFWRHSELADSSSSDIIIVHAAEHLIRQLPCQDAIVLPHYVHHILDVRGDWQDVQLRFHKSVRRNELRLVRKYGYEYDVSHDRQDFETFYYQMYVPTMSERHEELSTPLSIDEVYQYFRHGCLFRVTRGGSWVSGGVCHPTLKTLSFDVMGVKNADMRLIQEGAASTLYYAVVHWANQQGYEAVNFLGTGPYLGNGNFQYKRKWGMAISVPSHLHRQIWIKVRRITPAVSRFMKENPLIVVDQDGKLHGLITVDDLHNISADTTEEWKKDYITPGLSSLLVRSINCFAEEPPNVVRELDLIIPISLGNSSGGGR